MMGFSSILLLPITGVVLRNSLRSRDFVVSSRLASFYRLVTLAAGIGVVLVLISGPGLMWTTGIGLHDLGNADKWLGYKLVLLAIVIVILAALIAPATFGSASILRHLDQSSVEPTGDQDAALQRNFSRTYMSLIAMGVLLICIILLATFQPPF